MNNCDNVVCVFGIENGVAPPPPLPLTGNSYQQQSLASKPFLEMIVNTLQCSENDYAALFALCLLYALGHNPGTVHVGKRFVVCFGKDCNMCCNAVLLYLGPGVTDFLCKPGKVNLVQWLQKKCRNS